MHDLKRLFTGNLPTARCTKWSPDDSSRLAGRGVELFKLASGWRFRARAEFPPYLVWLNGKTMLRYSRARDGTVAIIAHRQPVARGRYQKPFAASACRRRKTQTLTERGLD